MDTCHGLRLVLFCSLSVLWVIHCFHCILLTLFSMSIQKTAKICRLFTFWFIHFNVYGGARILPSRSFSINCQSPVMCLSREKNLCRSVVWVIFQFLYRRSMPYVRPLNFAEYSYSSRSFIAWIKNQRIFCYLCLVHLKTGSTVDIRVCLLTFPIQTSFDVQSNFSVMETNKDSSSFTFLNCFRKMDWYSCVWRWHDWLVNR